MGPDNCWHVFNSAKVYREDLAKVFNDARSTELSGFFARMPKQNIDTNKPVRFSIILINKQTRKKYYAGFTKSDI